MAQDRLLAVGKGKGRVRLLINMLLEGELLKAGSEIELERIPPRLRKRKYLIPVYPGPPSAPLAPSLPHPSKE